MKRWQDLLQKAKEVPKKVYIAAGCLILSIFIIFAVYSIYRLQETMQTSLQNKQLITPIEFYSAPDTIFTFQRISRSEILDIVKKVLPDESFGPRDVESCKSQTNIEQDIGFCLYVELEEDAEHPGKYLIGMNDNAIAWIYSIDEKRPKYNLELLPHLFAQYYGNRPILKTQVELGDTPPLCLNALLAIEDNEFLEHSGFNLKSIFRALFRNIVEGRKAQGGSTITQQLVKNYFLTHEKTYIRKLKELIMAVLLETQFTKDQILEAYINEIYMGQNGTFEIRGFGSASEHFFRKKLEDLDLAECSLLAAIINSPGRFDPFSKPENAMTRRQLVLDKLKENEVITLAEYEAANKEKLPSFSEQKLESPAPYFMEAVISQIDSLGIEKQQGLKIYTTLNLRAQKAAEEAVKAGIERIYTTYKDRLPKGEKPLQAVLISADPVTGHVQSLIGGTSYKFYPYNRALKSHRQVGSTMKAFVFLSALESFTAEGNPYTPLTILPDERFTTSYDDKSWSPKNFEDRYYGNVPMFFALKNSLNTATAKVAIDTGLESIVTLARNFGITSPMQAVPALSLGAFELYPWELLQAYLTIARMGSRIPITYVRYVTDLEDEILFEHIPRVEQVFNTNKVAVLIGMMKHTIDNGTGKLARLLGFKSPAAGKTGTTSDSKDSWFAGFTPNHVAIAWVGYDDNTTHNLTGASGALPIWTHYMKNYGQQFPDTDFNWPEGVYSLDLDRIQLTELGISDEEAEKMGDIQIILEKSQSNE
jgi:penicillin-binding protein 1B